MGQVHILDISNDGLLDIIVAKGIGSILVYRDQYDQGDPTTHNTKPPPQKAAGDGANPKGLILPPFLLPYIPPYTLHYQPPQGGPAADHGEARAARRGLRV